MKILFDTHIYFWWVTGDRKLPPAMRRMVEDSSIEALMSAVIPWELATKSRLGKWPSARRVLDEIEGVLEGGTLVRLPITTVHARIAGLFPVDHRDPFDRMLAAQAKCEGVPLVTVDAVFRNFDIEILS